MHNVTFAACSYIKDPASLRAGMVRKAIKSWCAFLDLPFAEKIFLDDHSPDSAALKVLASSSMQTKFDRVEYHSLQHAPHSNFGIVGCLHLASSPFILHLDDDIMVTTSADECREFLEQALGIMENNPTIMGCNIVTFDAKMHGPDWAAGEVFPPFPSWSHPQKFYGTAATLIRRELLQRVTFEQIIAWGANQPANWEELVTTSVKEFLVPQAPTPFAMPDSAFFYSSTIDRTSKEYRDFYLQRLIFNAKQILRENLPAPLLDLSRTIRGIKPGPDSKK